MASTVSLLQSILHTPIPLRSITSIRLTLHKSTSSESKQASLRHFLTKRLPGLRFHTPTMQVQIRRVKSEKEGKAGLEVTRNNGDKFLLNHQTMRDDELLNSIVALDKSRAGEVVEGVSKGELGEIKVAAKKA